MMDKYLEMAYLLIGLTLVSGVMLGAILAIALGVFQKVTSWLKVPRPILVDLTFNFNTPPPHTIMKDGREVEWLKELPEVMD